MLKIVYNSPVILNYTLLALAALVINMFTGGILRLIVVYILTGNRNIGIVGTPIGAMLCFLCIAVLNLISMRRCISDPPAIVKNLIKPFLAAAIMGIFVWGSLKLLTLAGITSRLILCALPVIVGVVVYVAAVLALKVITKEDCLLLPKGEKIAKLLHL